jgi:hypothetical protein
MLFLSASQNDCRSEFVKQEGTKVPIIAANLSGQNPSSLGLGKGKRKVKDK